MSRVPTAGAAGRDASADGPSGWRGCRGGARVVNLREVPAFPIPAVEVGELASMLSSVPVADVSDVALVNMVSAWQQVVNMAQAAQAEVIREIEARTTDALARVPDAARLRPGVHQARRHRPVRARMGRRTAPRRWPTPGPPARSRPARWTSSWPRPRPPRPDRRERRRRRGGSGRRADRAPQLTRHVRATVIATDPRRRRDAAAARNATAARSSWPWLPTRWPA